MSDATYEVAWRSENLWSRHGRSTSLSYEHYYVAKVFGFGPAASSSFVERVGELEIPKPLQREIAPILKLMTPLNRQIERATKD